MKFNLNRKTKDLEIITDHVKTSIDVRYSEFGIKTEIIDNISDLLTELLLDNTKDNWYNNELVNRIFLNLRPEFRIAELKGLLKELDINPKDLLEDERKK